MKNMKLELILSSPVTKHIIHYTENGEEKIEVGKKGAEKTPILLKYINDYCTRNNMKIFLIEGPAFYISDK